MIITSAKTAAIFLTLTERARTIALGHGEVITRSRRSERLDWHSANSLWPDLSQD